MLMLPYWKISTDLPPALSLPFLYISDCGRTTITMIYLHASVYCFEIFKDWA